MSPAGRLSKAKTQLVVGRLLSLDGSNQLPKAQTVLNESTEQLIECLHLANCLSFSTRDSELQGRKHRQMQRECYKLLMITLIMTNKNHMKLGHEEAAAMGCNIIKASVSRLDQGFAFFKRLLQPEVYLLDQYKRYRAEKKELVEVATWYFGDLVAKVEGEKEEEQLLFRKKERRVEGERGARISDQWAERGSDEISTVKTISIGGKRKGNSSLLNCRNPSYDGMQSRHIGDTIITKMIINHVEELNRGYTGLRNQIGIGSYYKAIQGKHVSSQKTIPRTLKKQKLAHQVISNSPEPDSQRTARLQLEEARGRKEAKEAKAQLERRGKMPLRNLTKEEVVEPVICQLEREIDNGRHMLEMSDSESGSFSQDETEVKCGNMRTKRTKVFIEILFLNREGLGIKKLVEKFELLKKKEEQKQKMISIRAANSYGRDKGQRLFKAIAGEILKKHLGKKGSHSEVRGSDSGDKSRMVQASHALGQDSIQAIRAKLADKMDRQERVCNKSQLSEEVFKAKLKRLGSSNFFLKRVGDGKTEMKVKRASIETTRTSKIKFWDPIEES